MEVPRLGVELELQLPAYTPAMATPDLSGICGLCNRSQQFWIFHLYLLFKHQLCPTGFIEIPLTSISCFIIPSWVGIKYDWLSTYPQIFLLNAIIYSMFHFKTRRGVQSSKRAGEGHNFLV